MGKLIVLGTEDDPHIPRVLRHFAALGGSYQVMDYRRAADLTFAQSGDIQEWSINGEPIGKEDLIWNRMKLWFGSPFFFDDEIEGETKAEKYRRNMVRLQEWNGALHALKSLHPGAVVNCPSSVARMNKPLQRRPANGTKPPTISKRPNMSKRPSMSRRPSRRVIGKRRLGPPDRTPTLKRRRNPSRNP